MGMKTLSILTFGVLWIMYQGIDAAGLIIYRVFSSLRGKKSGNLVAAIPTIATIIGYANSREENQTSSGMIDAGVFTACSTDSLGTFSETAIRPNFTVLEEIGEGQTGTVLAVRLYDGQLAALKCSCVSGRFLLNDYGALLDLQPTQFVPKVWGYYKPINEGDCYFMSLLGPSLRMVRQNTLPHRWPSRTIASIGLIMLSAIESFSKAKNGYVLHGDAFVGNLVLGPSENNTLSRKLFFIDFDLSRRKYIPRDFYPEVRQVLYTLRFLHDGDESSPFFQIMDHRDCHADYGKDCSPAYPKLCQAIEYACSFDGVPGKGDGDVSQEIDLERIRDLLRDMLEGEENDEIFWPEWISFQRIVSNK